MLNRTYADHGRSESEVAASDKKYAALYPTAVRISGYTPIYNCSSYALYRQSTSNNVWMGAPYSSQDSAGLYFTDGSYVKTSEPSIGDILTYGGNTTNKLGPAHVAVIKTRYRDEIGTVRSKWGSMGLYDHQYLLCPYVEDTGYLMDTWKAAK